MNDLAIRFGGTLTETSLTSQRHFPEETSLTSPENTLFQAENSDSDISDICDVSPGIGDVSRASDITYVTIPDGWSKTAWIERLEQLAEACSADRPDKAADYRKQVDELRGLEVTK